MSFHFKNHTHLLFSPQLPASVRENVTENAISCVFSKSISAGSYEETEKKCRMALRCLIKNTPPRFASIRFDVIEHKKRRDKIFYVWPPVKQTAKKASRKMPRKNISLVSKLWNEWHRGVSKIMSVQISHTEREREYRMLSTSIAGRMQKISIKDLYSCLGQEHGRLVRKKSAFLFQFVLHTEGDYRRYMRYLKKEHEPVVLNEYAKTLLALSVDFSIHFELLAQFLSAPSIPLNEKGLLLLYGEIKKGNIPAGDDKSWKEVARLSEISIPLIRQPARRIVRLVHNYTDV